MSPKITTAEVDDLVESLRLDNAAEEELARALIGAEAELTDEDLEVEL